MTFLEGLCLFGAAFFSAVAGGAFALAGALTARGH